MSSLGVLNLIRRLSFDVSLIPKKQWQSFPSYSNIRAHLMSSATSTGSKVSSNLHLFCLSNIASPKTFCNVHCFRGLSYLIRPQKNPNPKNEDDEWQVIFRFKHIVVARLIQRMKIYQTFFTCCLLTPTTLGCYLYGITDGKTLIYTVSISAFACGMLYVMGNFVSRVIGIIYVNKDDPDVVKIAHLTFWGSRCDEVFDRADIVPISELNTQLDDVYLTVANVFDRNNPYFISLKYGDIFDEERFFGIFDPPPRID